MIENNNIIKNKIIIQNTNTYINNTTPSTRYHLNLYIDNRLMTDYLSLKAGRNIKKDSALLRPIIRMGITGAKWLEEKGLLSLNDYKLTKILAGLSTDEKAELFELLRRELQV